MPRNNSDSLVSLQYVKQQVFRILVIVMAGANRFGVGLCYTKKTVVRSMSAFFVAKDNLFGRYERKIAVLSAKIPPRRKTMKKRITAIVCTLLVAVLLFTLAACTDKTKTTYTLTLDNNGETNTIQVVEGESCTLPIPKERDGYVFVGWYDGDTLLDNTFTPTKDMSIVGKWERHDALANELKESLKAYLQTDTFSKSVKDARTTQARVPLLYLRYVKGDFYTNEVVLQFKKYLNMIDGVIEDGKIKDSLFATSSASTQGWYGMLDFLYSWSAIANQYQQWCTETGTTDTSYWLYFVAIKSYISNIDTYLSNSNVKYTFKGEETTQSNLYYKGYNAINNISNAKYRLSYDDFVELLSLVAQATGNTDGHAAFLAEYKKIDFATIDAASDKNTQYGKIKPTIMALWKSCLPVTQVAFGYSAINVSVITAYNLGFDLETTVPYCSNYMLSYYEKDDEGNFKKNGGTPNWVGFSGRPLAGSIFRGNARYDVKFEKTMQGYFPFTDGWNQPLDEMINMDRLCNYYNHTLTTNANVDPRYGLLYGFMNGIDMEHYVKEVYHSQVCTGEDCKYHIDEQDGQVYNIVTMWRETLKKDENGKYVISNNVDMAVAIAYIAHVYGVEAPTPLGLYNAAQACIDLGL